MINKKEPELIAGFTLLEILIVFGIIGIIATFVSYFAIDIFKLQLFVTKNLDIESEAQYVFKIITPELRSIGPSSNGGYPILSAASSSFSFYSDIDNDGLFEQVRYFLDASTLKKGVIKPSGFPLSYDPANEKITELIGNVISSNIFYYFDKDYSGVNGSALGYPMNLSAIRVVKAALTIDEDPNIEPGPFIASVVVNIRNLRGL